MKEKIKNIWKRACAFFAQPDKQKHFTVGALACALVTIAVVLQDIPLGLTPAGALLMPLVGMGAVFVASVIWELIGKTGFDWSDILAAMAGCMVVWLSTAYGAWLWYLNV